MGAIVTPPKMVYDESGQLIEVILAADDYLTYLRTVARESDWEALPPHLQDAIDRMLVDEVREEKEETFDLAAVLGDDTEE